MIVCFRMVWKLNKGFGNNGGVKCKIQDLGHQSSPLFKLLFECLFKNSWPKEGFNNYDW